MSLHLVLLLVTTGDGCVAESLTVKDLHLAAGLTLINYCRSGLQQPRYIENLRA